MRTTVSLDDKQLATAQSYTGLRKKSALIREALKALIERPPAQPSTIRVELPFHLRSLASISTHSVSLPIEGEVTTAAILNALEARYPMLLGTIRDQVTHQRRPFLRFFACEQDLTHDPPNQPLPAAVASGKEVFIILGAIAGG